MKNIFFLVLLSVICSLSYSQSSGDVVVITPTNKVAPPTDATNDSGSGVDDEDGEDGSTPDPSTVATTLKVSTGVVTTSPGDEDGSGESSSGYTSVMPSTEKTTGEVATDSTDIYISESTTKTVIVTDPATPTVRSQTTAETTTDSGDHGKTSGMTDSNVVYATTTTKTTPADEKLSSAVPSEPRTPSTESTTAAIEETTTETDFLSPDITAKVTKPKTDSPTKIIPRETSTPEEKTTTVSNEPGVFAQKGKSKEKDFTLTTEVIAGVVGCALLALLLIAFLMYRLKKRDEGSYLLDDSCGRSDAYKKVDLSDKEAFV